MASDDSTRYKVTKEEETLLGFKTGGKVVTVTDRETGKSYIGGSFKSFKDAEDDALDEMYKDRKKN